MNPERLLYEIESFLTANGSFYFLHFFLKSFYEQITNGQVKVVLAPIDDAISRVESVVGKKISDFVRTEEGRRVLGANFSSSDLDLVEGHVLYTGLSGARISTVQELEALEPIANLELPGLRLYVTKKIFVDYGALENLKQVDLAKIPPEKLFPLPITTKYDSLPGDIIRKIALQLTLKEILAECLTSRSFNRNICDNEEFWKAKVFQDVPNADRWANWKKTYMLAFATVFVMGKSNSYNLGVKDDQVIHSPSKMSIGTQRDFVEKEIISVRHVACCNNFTLIYGAADTPSAVKRLFSYGLAGGGFTTERFLRIDKEPNALTNALTKAVITQIAFAANHAFWINNKNSRGHLYCNGYVSEKYVTVDGHEIRLNQYGNSGQLGFGEGFDFVGSAHLPIVGDGSTDNVTMVATCPTRTMVINNGKLYGFGA